MNSFPPIAQDLLTGSHLEQGLLKILAVAGAAAIGGLLIGFLTQALGHMVARRGVPHLPLNIIRLLAAVAFGMAAWFFLGPGGGLGLGRGSGTGSGQGEHTGGTEMGLTTGRQDTGPATGQTGSATPSTICVEVLGDARVKGERCYRLEGQPGLHNLAEVRGILEQRQKAGPSVQELAIMVYMNSPDPNHPLVRQLEALAKKLNLTPTVKKPDSRAP